jgi:hypothetical protein
MSETTSKKPQGVDGWLRFFWFCLVFFGPLALIASVIQTQGLEAITIALALAGCSVFVGIRLKRTVKPAAGEIIAEAGPLRRALQVGYHSEVSATFQLNNSHASRTTQVAYIAWFQKSPKPILLLVERTETDGVLQGYRINQGAPMSLVGGAAFPLVFFAFSLVLFLKRKSAMFRHT